MGYLGWMIDSVRLLRRLLTYVCMYVPMYGWMDGWMGLFAANVHV